MTQPTPEMLKLLDAIREEHWPDFDKAIIAAIQRTTDLVLRKLDECCEPCPTCHDAIAAFDHLKGQSDE